MTSSDDEDATDAALFQEPEGYFQPEKPATYTEHTLLSGQALRLRLVGHSPLWVRIFPTYYDVRNFPQAQARAEMRW